MSAIAEAGAASAATIRLLFRDHACLSGDLSLSGEELERNLSLVFFGGISTVEALILNALANLLPRPDLRVRLHSEPQLLPRILEETMRWSGPVQSATRHATRNIQLGDAIIEEGETVNCMLASANRDESVFDRADMFDPDRTGVSRYLGFAAGPHHCLGAHLARLEAATLISTLLRQFPDVALLEPSTIDIRGHEFRQPTRLRCSLG